MVDQSTGIAHDEIYLGEFPEMFGGMIREEDVFEGMKALGLALGRLGYCLSSGRGGKTDEVWAIQQHHKSRLV
jgi:hypothetical protein